MRRVSARPCGGGSTGCVVLQATGERRAGDRRKSRLRNGAPLARFAPRPVTRGVPGGSLLRVPGLQVLWRTLDTRARRLGVLSGWQNDAREVGVSPLRHRRIDHAHPALRHPRSESPRDFPRLPRSARPLAGYPPSPARVRPQPRVYGRRSSWPNTAPQCVHGEQPVCNRAQALRNRARGRHQLAREAHGRRLTGALRQRHFSRRRGRLASDMRKIAFTVFTIGLIAGSAALSAAPLDESRVARIVRAELKKLGVPSASVAIVLDDRIAYAQAFGNARLNPQRAATSTDRYQIGSISKQFLAASMLMLQEDGKLSLENKVGQYLPELDSAANVTLRQLLSHTAGMRDFWPQDYVFTRMLSPIAPTEIMDRWARQPLDFPPGERWQYSNTGYTLGGVIFEKVAGEPLFASLQRCVFGPLHMSSVANADEGAVDSSDAVGYTRAALGPLRPAPHVAKGWLFAAGELAMTAEDLARWDLSVIDEAVMKPASYREFEREILR